ncbi:MAG TPA: NAD-dependent epimerase/dehydratase family protein [Candidatus Rifleibacterium sp.]|nr:NAD-dependent epimerase/dehydratase family protein [Candidatus Rifleibacterium sp.]
MNAKNKVIIAGGTGFIGKEVVKRLQNEFKECIVISRNPHKDCSNVRFYRLDLNNCNPADYSKIIEAEGNFDVAIYLAANIPALGQKKETFFEAKCSTFDPFVSFCQGLVSNVKKMIYASSIDVVGIPLTEDYDEEVFPRPVTPYALAKLCGESFAECFCRNLKIPLIQLRFSQVYGPNEPLVRIIPILLKSLTKGEGFTKFTTGNEKRRFLFVEDAAKAVLCAINADKEGIFNIAGASVNSINELINLAEQVFEKRLNVIQKDSLVASSNVPSIAKAECELAFSPDVPLLKGLEKIREAMSE